ncbi:hypothetical protein L596_007634 [Steinernema carpocapsae]|uniref:EGF-like domain-containing protein n=1 Tax=Steinernema carpocapsae TaxID=34508 RepID=A0A4U5P9Y3_STECR|nr:hypothetical protein L596_007634 [Steinernema carpocapsae]
MRLTVVLCLCLLRGSDGFLSGAWKSLKDGVKSVVKGSKDLVTCGLNCETKSPPTTIPTTTTPVGFCHNCSEFSFCEQPTDSGCLKCICPKGLRGDCCDQIEHNPCNDPNSCHPEATCEFQLVGSHKCVCDDPSLGCYEPPNPCEPNPCVWGTCSVNETSGDFECACDKGYVGKQCETTAWCTTTTRCSCEVQTTLCENNSTCYIKDEYDYNTGKYTYLDNVYYCLCGAGFYGPGCGSPLPCTTGNPCEHGGICEVDKYDKTNSWCACPSIWTGKNCETYDPCHKLEGLCVNGKCKAVNNLEAACDCIPGYNGTFCEHDIDDCAPSPCEYGGICSDMVNNYTCECPLGTSGHSCEINFDDCATDDDDVNVCMERDKEARCIDGLNTFTCNCSAEWTTENCTMLTIIWNVMQKFDNSEIDLRELLEELVAKPALIKDIIPFFLALMSSGNQTVISWDHDDLFTYASFEGEELDTKKDLVRWNAATLGNCFTFNHDSYTAKLPLRYSGSRKGLKLLMRVRQGEYLNWIDTASMLVFVHSSTETVFGESLRFQAKPGSETSLMISQSTFERLGGAYGVCVDDKDEVESYYYDGEYTTDGCLRSCYQDAVYEACGCMDPRFPRKGNVSSCDLPKRNCVMNITNTLGDPSHWPSCVCPLPCVNGQFNVQWSSAGLNSKGFNSAYFSSNLEILSGFLSSFKERKLLFRNSGDEALISIYFPQLIQQTFKEEPKMDVSGKEPFV